VWGWSDRDPALVKVVFGSVDAWLLTVYEKCGGTHLDMVGGLPPVLAAISACRRCTEVNLGQKTVLATCKRQNSLTFACRWATIVLRGPPCHLPHPGW
jgi:hypothetical protein